MNGKIKSFLRKMVKLVKIIVLTYNHILGFMLVIFFSLSKTNEVANGAVCKYRC